MESLQSKLSVSAMTAYFGIFKEPRGLIRALQFIFAIFAFATACNGRSSVALITTDKSTGISTSWSYPYNLRDTPIVVNGSAIPTTLSDASDTKRSAEFFVFTGVTSMLLSLAFAVLYVVMDRQYRNDERFPIVDLVVSTVWAIFWIAGSSAWAQGVSNIRSQTDPQNVANRSGTCPVSNQCTATDTGTYANIIVSVIFGFLNFFLWVGSMWFVYKETKFFKSRTAQQQPQTAPSDFSNISSPPVQQQSQTRPPGSLG